MKIIKKNIEPCGSNDRFSIAAVTAAIKGKEIGSRTVGEDGCRKKGIKEI